MFWNLRCWRAAFLPALVLAYPAMAQDFFGNIVASQTGNDPIGIALRESDSVGQTVSRNLTTSPSSEQYVSALTFDHDNSATKRNLHRFVQLTRIQGVSKAADLERLFSSVDVIGEVGRAMRGYGLDPNNVADAYTAWWVSAWSAANGVKSPSDTATYRAVQRQARAAFTATPDFANTSDADRQQFAETMMVQAALLDTANDGLRGSKPEGMVTLADNARKGAKDMGIDLDTMVLTPDGFGLR